LRLYLVLDYKSLFIFFFAKSLDLFNFGFVVRVIGIYVVNFLDLSIDFFSFNYNSRDVLYRSFGLFCNFYFFDFFNRLLLEELRLLGV
jgi:hypothetical protein